MTLFGRCRRYKCIKHFRMRFWVGPILRDTSPLRSQAFLIGIGILDDESLHPLWMRQNNAESDRPAVVMKIEDAFADLELLEEIVDRLRQMIKGVRIRRWWWRVTLTEAWKGRRYRMIARGEQGNECIELARGRGKPVQQHKRRRVLGAGFPIEDPDAINRHAVIGRCSGCGQKVMFN
jgi:hypothetical protein